MMCSELGLSSTKGKEIVMGVGETRALPLLLPSMSPGRFQVVQ